jgi:hypothetical protein
MDEHEHPADPAETSPPSEPHPGPRPAGQALPLNPGARQKAWWRDVATVLGVLGLLITLIFNTLGVWEQLAQSRRDAKQAAETRRHTQIGVLTQLASEARTSERVITSSRLPDLRCDSNYRVSDLTPADYAALDDALGVYDYMAWLFNARHLTQRSARQLWAPRIIDAAELGGKLLSPRDVKLNWPELWRFQSEAPREFRPPNRCASGP